MAPTTSLTGPKAPALATLRRLVTYITNQRVRLFVAISFLVLGSIIMAFQPLIFGQAVDELSRGNSSNVGLLAVTIVALALGSGILTYFAQRQLAVLAQRGMEQLRNDLFDKMQTLSLRFFDAESSGDLSARITSDIEAVNQFFSSAISRVISAGMTVITMLFIMLSLDLVMTLVVMLIVPLSFAVITVVGRRVQADFASYQQRVGALNGYVEEAIVGQRTVKAFAREEETAQRVRALSEEARVVDRSSQFLSYLIQPANGLVTNLDIALVALIGGARALSGSISVGDVVAFVGYGQQFGGQSRQLSQVITQVLSAIAGGNRVFEILDRDPDIKDSANASPMPSADGRVDFDHVDFSYTADKQILFDNDFHVRPGQLIGLVGPTGAGKSTIINLLNRFYDIESGEIKLDDQSISEIVLDDLRLRCGVVLQVPFLFHESVMYNLQYGREGATEAECIEAATSANAHGFISRLPNGYETVLAEGAENLSQGQRQLLTIARAIVANPDVLILDEATSSVDTRTERRIQGAIDALMETRTSFVIAHRLSTVRHADAIISLDSGRILEMGSHDELMAARGSYYNLYMEQFRPELATALVDVQED